ncbi:threonine aldolase family protein [Aureibacter tunicatorum]|uniref:Threonine aldolase n=1 Tax=Aureibacter tunicatorum TaxID=866807 RepID=A0AAE4BRY6_9BACT|nr:GntG family PLP-dependent aldolase [Aureibacter tunicatorum]MDR6238348.1 threonine aldolase [Aureibacter tunicatorum]BDD03380.1 threonine aldolase [Aureibacter tunicatorum]
MNKLLDFRSDTVTKPSEAMLQAMVEARVGDDVFGEDPSVKLLENLSAAMFGMESAIFCPSGTMTNQIAIKLHTQPGDEVICDSKSHIYNYEGGGIAFNSMCSVALANGDRGRFNATQAQELIKKDDIHFPNTSLISVENTMNKGGGACYDWKELEELSSLAKSQGLAFHLDGARLFNALVAKNENPRQYGEIFDTISICLSKGLGAPVGSLLIGKTDHIKKAKRIRKAFGGGMRQAGFMAAAGIYALENNVERLATDHNNAKILASELSKTSFVEQIIEPETNIVIITLKELITPEIFLDKLKEINIQAVHFGGQNIRFVTHLDLNSNEINEAIERIKKLEL